MVENKLGVTVELGVTLSVGDMGFVKPTIKIEHIDPDGDVDDQIRRAMVTAVKAFAEIDGQLEVVVSELLAPATGMPSFKGRMELVEGNLDTARTNIQKIAAKIRDLDKKVSEAVKERVASGQEAG